MKPTIKLMWNTPDSEYQIVRATRICYGSEDKTDSRWEPTENAQTVAMGGGIRLDIPMMRVCIGPKDESLLRRIMSNQHNTCLRFASAAFHIDNISRVCSHQLVRISHFGILQRSQRYCSEESAGWAAPDDIVNPETMEVINSCWDTYNKLIKEGVKEEDARYVLPNCATTQINMVSNFQGWKHFLKIRLSDKVQLETRKVAVEICRQLYDIAPIVFEADYSKLGTMELS